MRLRDSSHEGITRLLVLALIACGAGLLSGCSFFGYYRYKGAERAPPTEAEKIVFPTSYEKGVHLDGPMMAALEVARNEFMPPGAKIEAHNEQMAQCLRRRDIYDVSILKASDDLYFVNFSPEWSRCNINMENFIILDGEVTYAIDGHGRVLAVQ